MSLKEALFNYALLLELPDPKAFEEEALEAVKKIAERMEDGRVHQADN